jgi:hypothetical protein
MPRALAVAFVLLTACNSSASPAPKGWDPIPGASGAWSSGSGSNAQQYVYHKNPFGGALPDLASQVTIDVLLQHHGAKLKGSQPFGPCPAAAGLATFALPADKTLQIGFAVRDDQAVRVNYIRPAGAPIDSNAAEAMQRVLCTL